MGEAVGLAVQDDADITLAPEIDILGTMRAGAREAERPQQPLETGSLGLRHRELDELDRFDRGGWRHRYGARHRLADLPCGLVEQPDQRAMTIERDGACRAGPEAVVEDFKREHAVIAG